MNAKGKAAARPRTAEAPRLTMVTTRMMKPFAKKLLQIVTLAIRDLRYREQTK